MNTSGLVLCTELTDIGCGQQRAHTHECSVRTECTVD